MTGSKKLLAIFGFAFAFNLFWESLHYSLYIPIHSIVRLPGVTIFAALLDALFVLAIFLLFNRTNLVWKIVAALLVSLSIERWALFFNIWEYKNAMPIIPFLETGLSPTVQLAVTIAIVYFSLKINKNPSDLGRRGF